MNKDVKDSQAKDFRLRVQKVKPNSKESLLLEFIQSADLMPQRQILIWTLSMCWGPWAYEKVGTEPETIRRIASEAAYQLQIHLDYLRDTFALERPYSVEKADITITQETTSPQATTDNEELLGEYDLESLGFDDFSLNIETFKEASVKAEAA